MDGAVVAALITASGTIVAALIGVFVLRRGTASESRAARSTQRIQTSQPQVIRESLPREPIARDPRSLEPATRRPSYGNGRTQDGPLTRSGRSPQRRRPPLPTGPPKFPDFVDVRWRLELPGELHQPTLVTADGAVHLITRNGALVCVAPNGKLRWSAVLGGGGGIGGQGLARSAAGDLLAVTDGYIHSVGADGTKQWRWTAHGGFTAAPAIGPDGTLYAMSNQSTLWAVSSNGRDMWDRPLCKVHGGGTWPSPAYGADGLVYAACRGRDVYGVSPDNGEVIWTFAINDKVSSSPITSQDGTGYFATDAGWVFAIDSAGTQRWVTSVSGGSGKIASIDAPLAIGPHGQILVAPRHGTVYSITPEGTIQWGSPIGGQGTGDRAVAAATDGSVYAATTHRELVGISADGQEFLRVASDGWVSAPAVGPKDVVHVGFGTQLFALDIGR